MTAPSHTPNDDAAPAEGGVFGISSTKLERINRARQAYPVGRPIAKRRGVNCDCLKGAENDD